MRASFYEKRLRSFDSLMSELRRHDAVSGVRVVGSSFKTECFAFLTRSGGVYTVMIYESKDRRATALGARILSREFKSVDYLVRFLRQIARKEVKAYVY